MKVLYFFILLLSILTPKSYCAQAKENKDAGQATQRAGASLLCTSIVSLPWNNVDVTIEGQTLVLKVIAAKTIGDEIQEIECRFANLYKLILYKNGDASYFCPDEVKLYSKDDFKKFCDLYLSLAYGKKN